MALKKYFQFLNINNPSVSYIEENLCKENLYSIVYERNLCDRKNKKITNIYNTKLMYN